MSERPFYLINPSAWNARTGHLTLELEAAYLRLCNHAHDSGTIIVRGRWTFQGLFRCGASRARSLLAKLASAGMVELIDDDAVRVAGVRLARTALPLSLRAQIFARDGMVCVYCATVDGPFEIDHIAPVARGGSDEPSNLCVACETCNRSKGAKLLAEWLA